jgi:hypothetical protein
MSEQSFDAFTRRAAQAVSRRQSLMALGGATLAAAAAKPSIAEAKKNKNKKAKKKAKKKCKQQVPQCEAAVAQANGIPQQIQCCQFLSNCNAGSFVQCIASANRQLAE